jgi:hypothetical protein
MAHLAVRRQRLARMSLKERGALSFEHDPRIMREAAAARPVCGSVHGRR